jgi:hypothetical protein
MSLELYEERMVKTRKSHRCFGCRKEFPKGRRILYNKGLFDGKFFSGYLCSPCDKVRHNGDYRDGYSEGELREARVDNANYWISRRR